MKLPVLDRGNYRLVKNNEKNAENQILILNRMFCARRNCFKYPRKE